VSVAPTITGERYFDPHNVGGPHDPRDQQFGVTYVAGADNAARKSPFSTCERDVWFRRRGKSLARTCQWR
jgi:hypothetical protein